MVAEQLELFHDSPFSLRLRIPEALHLFWVNYWSRLPSSKTTKAHFYRIGKFFESDYLDTISQADVERFLQYLKDGLKFANASVNKHHMILSRLYRKFEEYKEGGSVNGQDFSRLVLPKKNPSAQVRKLRGNRRDVIVDANQKRLLCGFCDEDLYEIIDTLWWSELRPGDLFAVTDQNVDIRHWVLHGIQSKTISSRNREGLPYRAPIPQSKRAVIMRRLENAKPGTPIFKKKNLQKRWAKVRRLASKVDPYLAKVQLRDMKPSAHSYLLDENTDLETARKKAGWADGRMVAYYDKRPEDRVQKAAEKLAKI